MSSMYRFPKKGRKTVYKNHLGITHPELAKEFDEEKNEGLKIENLTHGSERRVWWKCSTCGESWNHSIFRRRIGKANCPVCKIKVEEDTETVAKQYPELVKEWNYELNKPYTPENTHVGSCRRIHWKCSVCSHEWNTQLRTRTHGGTGCKVCGHKRQREKMIEFYLKEREDSIYYTRPDLTACFNDEMNYPVLAKYVTENSNRNLYWTCKHCSHTINKRALTFIKAERYKTCEKCGKDFY